MIKIAARKEALRPGKGKSKGCKGKGPPLPAAKSTLKAKFTNEKHVGTQEISKSVDGTSQDSEAFKLLVAHSCPLPTQIMSVMGRGFPYIN